MRTVIILMSLVGTTTSWAADKRITICFPAEPGVNTQTLLMAQGYASRIYHSMGLDLHWKGFCTAAELDLPGAAQTPNLVTIGVQWIANAPVSASPSARAAAYPYQPTGTRINLYLDRLAPALAQEKNFAASVLGHVLAHEIGHVLLGYNNHAEKGLMKASWSSSEQRDMRRQPLGFTEENAARIRRNLERAPGLLSAAR